MRSEPALPTQAMSLPQRQTLSTRLTRTTQKCRRRNRYIPASLHQAGRRGSRFLHCMMAVACQMIDQEQVSRAGQNTQKLRLPICIDLAPAATFISSVYLWPDHEDRFERNAALRPRDTDSFAASLYRDGIELSAADTVEYVLWIEARVATCQGEVVSNSVVKATTSIGSADEFPCPHCGALVSKGPTKASGAVRLERRLRTIHDVGTGGTRLTMRRVPVGAQVIRGQSGKAANRRTVPIAADARRYQMHEDFARPVS